MNIETISLVTAGDSMSDFRQAEAEEGVGRTVVPVQQRKWTTNKPLVGRIVANLPTTERLPTKQG